MDTVQDASGQPFAGWLEGELARYYEPAAVLRRSDRKEILLYRHRESGQHIVYRRIRGRQPVYDSLCLFRSRNIAEVYETTFDGRDTLVIEEYVDGVTIADVLEKRLFTVKEMCGTIIQLCEGLHALHERHIIHRDIKPENVMIQHDGVVKLIDFDSSNNNAGHSRIRGAGTVRGSPVRRADRHLRPGHFNERHADRRASRENAGQGQDGKAD